MLAQSIVHTFSIPLTMISSSSAFGLGSGGLLLVAAVAFLLLALAVLRLLVIWFVGVLAALLSLILSLVGAVRFGSLMSGVANFFDGSPF